MSEIPSDTPIRSAHARSPVLVAVAIIAVCAMAAIGAATMVLGMSI